MAADEINNQPRGPRYPFRVMGFAFLVVGFLSILWPIFATIALVQLMAFFLILAGGTGFAMWWQMRNLHQTRPALGVAVLCLILGILFLLAPLVGAKTLTILLGLAFLAEAVLTFAFAWSVRERLSGWLWMMLSAFTALVMALLIFLGWPGTAVWVIGLLFGFNMVSSGVALLFLGPRPGMN